MHLTTVLSPAFFIAATLAFPAQNSGLASLQRRNEQPSANNHRIPRNNYPAGYWEGFDPNGHYRKNAPLYPYYIETYIGADDADRLIYEEEIVRKAHSHVNRCWFNWLKERDRQARIRKIPEAILFDQDIKEARRCVDEANVLFDVPYAFLPRTSPRPKQEGDSDNPVYTMPMIVKPADQKQTPKTSNWREDARKTFDAVTGSFHESMSGQKDRGRTSPSPVNPGGFKVAPPRRGFIHP